MEFKIKQYDGFYGVDFYNDNQLFKGVIYFPPKSYNKPYPLITFFHGFPHLNTLKEIIQDYNFLLDMGYAFMVFNFRGYQYSEGKVSIESQVSDALKVIEFIKKLVSDNIISNNDVNIMAHDFGAYIALITCSMKEFINRLLLISPILDLKRHINDIEFLKMLQYINRFLPGNVRGVENIADFIKISKDELEKEEFQLENVIKNLKIKRLKVILGAVDKITPIDELYLLRENATVKPEEIIIDCMDHECVVEEEIDKVNEGIRHFFESK